MEDSGIDSGDHNGDSASKPTASDTSSAGSSRSPSRISSVANASSAATRHIQRKLESRIPSRKFQQQQHQDYNNTPSLIPIQRLPVPGAKDHQPLVQWDTDDSEEEIVNFFPMSRKESRVHHEITDTFSIEEMSISGDEDEDDLHLVPPSIDYKKFGCCPFSCTVM